MADDYDDPPPPPPTDQEERDRPERFIEDDPDAFEVVEETDVGGDNS